MERGMGQNSPAFTSASAKRKSLDQKQNSGNQIKPFEQPLNAGTYPQKPLKAEEIQSLNNVADLSKTENLPNNPSVLESQAAISITKSIKPTTRTSILVNAIKSVNQIEKIQPQKVFPINKSTGKKNALNFVKQFPFIGRSNSLFAPQNDLFALDTSDLLRVIGWLFIIGGPILLIMGYSYIESFQLFILLCLFFVLIGLFYFWAANLSENLDEHCVAYRIGFWLTLIGWPLGFTLLVGVPLWIIGAIYDY
jgi:hypothetical protein